jgi:hypothetical protein
VNQEGNNTPERKAKMPFFEVRRDAGRQLSQELAAYADRVDFFGANGSRIENLRKEVTVIVL